MSKYLVFIAILFQVYYINCATTTTVCTTNPCKNGGNCTVLTSSTYNCTCAPNFSGATCNKCKKTINILKNDLTYFVNIW